MDQATRRDGRNARSDAADRIWAVQRFVVVHRSPSRGPHGIFHQKKHSANEGKSRGKERDRTQWLDDRTIRLLKRKWNARVLIRICQTNRCKSKILIILGGNLAITTGVARALKLRRVYVPE